MNILIKQFLKLLFGINKILKNHINKIKINRIKFIFLSIFTYSISLVNVTSRGQKKVCDPLGPGEGGPVQGDVHLNILDKGIRPLLDEIPDDSLVFMFTGPD